jgi:hypothetical protein
MQVDPGATIDALSSAIALLLPPSADSHFSPQIAILPAQTNLAGIGGFIGHSKAPPAERVARRLEGEVVVRVFAGTAADLLDAEAQISRTLLAASPGLLRQQGILRLQRVLDAPDRRLEAADGIKAPFGQELRFAVKFEHAPLPAESEGMIASVPQDLTLANPTRTGHLLYATEFTTPQSMGDFTPLAGTDLGTPQWQFVAATATEPPEVRETSSIGGGGEGMSGDKTGAYFILREGIGGGKVADFVLHAEVRSDGPGGIGLVFRYRDRGNFGFVLIEEPAGHRLFGRRRAGTGKLLDEGGQDPSQGVPPPPRAWLRLRLLAEGDRFELAINEIVALAGRDAGFTEPGLVGLFSRGNPNARFRHVRLTGL